MSFRLSSYIQGIALGALLVTAASNVRAGLIAFDQNVPWDMNAGGTAEDPALYILGLGGAITQNLSSGAYVGRWESNYNHLLIASGSTFTSSVGYVGSGSSSHYNQVNVIGTGSSWIISDRLEVGSSGSNNHLSVEDGAHVSAQWAYIGNDTDANDNSLNVLGAGSNATVQYGLMLGGSGSNNVLRVGYGGTLSTGSVNIGFESGANNNEAVVYDAGSTWSMTQLSIGYFDSKGNSLTIENGGLVSLSDFWSIDYALTIDAADDNFINFDGGFLAIEGNATGLLTGLVADGAFRFLDGTTWSIGDLNDFSFDYFATESDALAFSGYNGLAGYTIITNFAGSPIPEPSTYAVLAGCAVLGLAILRRRRARS